MKLEKHGEIINAEFDRAKLSKKINDINPKETQWSALNELLIPPRVARYVLATKELPSN